MNSLIAGLGHPSRKEGRAMMLIGSMDISRLMIYVQQVDENFRERENYTRKRANPGSRRVMQIDHPSNNNRRVLPHLLLMHLQL